MLKVSHISWKTGWRRSSLAEGLRFGSSSRQRRVRSFKAGDRVSGTLGGSCAHAIWKNGVNDCKCLDEDFNAVIRDRNAPSQPLILPLIDCDARCVWVYSEY